MTKEHIYNIYSKSFCLDGGPYPGVVDMFGGIGGTVEHRAALLAARGFATLALEYINLDAYGMREDLGYFEVSEMYRKYIKHVFYLYQIKR